MSQIVSPYTHGGLGVRSIPRMRAPGEITLVCLPNYTVVRKCEEVVTHDSPTKDGSCMLFGRPCLGGIWVTFRSGFLR